MSPTVAAVPTALWMGTLNAVRYGVVSEPPPIPTMTERKLMKKAATCCQITPGSDLNFASFFAPRNIRSATNIAMQPKSPVSQVPPLKAERS